MLIATGDALDTELFVRGNPVRIRFDAGCDKLREVVIGQAASSISNLRSFNKRKGKQP